MHWDKICDFLKEKVKELNRDGVILSLNFDLNSVTLLHLCCKAFPPENVYAVLFDVDKREKAEKLKEKFNFNLIERDLTPVMKKIEEEAIGDKGLRERLKLISLYYYGEWKNCLVLSDIDKTEWELGEFVKFGENGGDVAPFKDIYKSEVLEIGKELGIPEEYLKNELGKEEKVLKGEKEGLSDDFIKEVEKRVKEGEFKRSFVECLPAKESLDINCDEEAEKIIKFLRDVASKYGKEGAVVGVSGGIDSACVASLCVRAFGKNKVFALIMPEKDSNPESVKDAYLMCDLLDLDRKFIDLTPILEEFGIYDLIFRKLFPGRFLTSLFVKIGYRFFGREQSPYVEGLLGARKEWIRRVDAYHRIKHRIRMCLLYYYAEKKNYLVAGTANRSEALSGFFVKYGDGVSDVMPILHLYKTHVRKLSKHIGVPEKIIKKAPSPDLLPGITDELALKMTYETLDKILVGEVEKIDKKMVEYVNKLKKLSEHMREPPFVLCVKE